ncbi:Phosphoserine transaminase [Coemansia thaxteri]|uniref:phosphoserine transaminase n=1 Tax=Coemansia thaxteri TaxID=2663907 RepID=A0A9W8BG97_9FUNG|nr:Phosphoserine transaminase [Coemansia thaxteri]KAJ2009350.1 Phosphoserine transaminase [Coemansia thaxteri]KAJ2474017.1 Phosphoserine transaminase [Coemansia sp. RSA 2322]KAJ2478341.1 Phosphoserine transaminase [Coemansia sp. RSA 2320]
MASGNNTGLPYGRVWNFSAGPSVLPVSVLEEVQRDLLNYKGTGMSVMEMSHRSKTYDDIIEGAEATLRRVLKVPDNYAVIFLQGGGTGGFAASYLNLFACKAVRDKQRKLGRQLSCDYLVTGSWSKGGLKEAQRLGGRPNVVLDGVRATKTGAVSYHSLPPVSEWKLGKPEETAFVYYCENETIHGVETPSSLVVDAVDPSVPVICDMSSNMLSRPVDIKRFGAIIAGAQKNMGPAGVSLVIVRKDLLERDEAGVEAVRSIPSVLDWLYYASAGSMPHTPPTFAIYVCSLVFKWAEEQGLEALERLRQARSGLVYDMIDAHPEFYRGPVDRYYRSRMNVVFNLPTKELEAQFIAEAAKRSMIQLKGHRSVGGVRISLYNAMPLEGAQVFVEFMKEFYEANRL